MACKVRDIVFMHLDMVGGIFEVLGASMVGDCKKSDEIEDALRDLFIDILGIREILENDESINDVFLTKFYDSDSTNEDVIDALEDFIE